MLSNRLADLAERAQAADRQAAIADLNAISQAIATGTLLAEAKSLVKHGQWLPFLARAAIAERKAQRVMALAASGLRAQAVADLGGIQPALSFVTEWKDKTPAFAEAMVILGAEPEAQDDSDEMAGPVAYVWENEEDRGRFNVVVVHGSTCSATKVPLLMMIEGEEHRPIAAVIAWLQIHFPIPIGEWRMEKQSRRLAEIVAAPLLTQHVAAA